ncbi:MAG: L,D-transpeptidase family protein [Xanthomonadales bacterium]|nr:L,D-transpeptidase family protein [Xanthomonadales bacterium]
MNPIKKQLAGLLIVFLILAGSTGLQASNMSQTQQDIEQLLGTDSLTIRGVDILTEGLILDTYEDHAFAPFWTDTDKIKELMLLINNAADHGLKPSDYNIDVLNQVLKLRQEQPSAEIEAEADILLTESLFRYGYHRRFGKVKANAMDPNINFRRQLFHQQAPSKTLELALESSSLTEFIEKAAPTGPVYRQLQTKMKFYRDVAAKGGWPSIPDGPTLHPGDKGPRVALVRERLAATGHIENNPGAGTSTYDAALKAAIKAFQVRHQLGADGIAGKQTFAAMNVPVEHRIDQIRLSLERLRWVKEEAVDTMVVVNIAGFRAFFFKNGAIDWETRVMVGKNYRKTPIFRGDIAYLEFNPTWTIPPGILRNDTLPAIRKDPNYLASKNIQVIDKNGKIIDPSSVDWSKHQRSAPYTFRQTPGPHNSLGMVKFIFPNSHFVFLHDTPHRELFSQTERNFSSGCIRVQDPFDLAELILNDPVKYNRSELDAIVASRKTQRVHLKPKVPVIILYITASIGTDGEVRFYKDIYNRDQKVLDALNGPVLIQLPEE